jgi:hypothetical protein
MDRDCFRYEQALKLHHTDHAVAVAELRAHLVVKLRTALACIDASAQVGQTRLGYPVVHLHGTEGTVMAWKQ